MIGMIAAVTQNGVIGVENKLPFDYPEDMKHFRTTTANSTIIMGRKTFEGIGRPLPKRRNVVISRTKINNPDIETYSSMEDAISKVKSIEFFRPLLGSSVPSEPMTAPIVQNIWLVGGASIYEEGMKFADKIVLTLTPDVETRTPAVRFPWINPNIFALQEVKPLVPENPDCKLLLATYVRK